MRIRPPAGPQPTIWSRLVELVVVDRDLERLQNTAYAAVVGDVTDDDVLRAAGIERAQALIAALDDDADNVYVTLEQGAPARPRDHRPRSRRSHESEVGSRRS